MSFEKLEKSRVYGRQGVSIAVAKTTGNTTITRIGMGPEAQAALGLQSESRIELLCGAGDDAGTILIRKSADGPKGVRTGRQLFLVSSRIPGRSKRFAATSCAYEKRDGGIVVTLPPEHGGPAANVTPIKSKRA